MFFGGPFVRALIFFSLKFTRIWDLSLEKDEEEEAEFKAKTKEQVNAPADLPPQLLFVHQVCFVKLSYQDIYFEVQNAPSSDP